VIIGGRAEQFVPALAHEIAQRRPGERPVVTRLTLSP